MLISRNLYQTLILLNPKSSPTHATTWSGILCHAVLKERRRSRMDIK